MTDTNAEAIAIQTETEFRAIARAWKRKHAAALRKNLIDTHKHATETAAWYLHEHPTLYKRSTKEETLASHEMWMALMKQWFMDEVKP
jgi:hypothetical protein